MDLEEFNSYTLAEFDALLERLEQLRRRDRDTPAALICSVIANFAGKQAPDDYEFEVGDFILRNEQEAEEYAASRQDARIRASLEYFRLLHNGGDSGPGK